MGSNVLIDEDNGLMKIGSKRAPFSVKKGNIIYGLILKLLDHVGILLTLMIKEQGYWRVSTLITSLMICLPTISYMTSSSDVVIL